MRDLKNKLTSGKNTKNIQRRKGKMFGYQVLGFGSGGVPFEGMCATGGTTSTDGDYKVHVFTSPGTFEVVSASNDPAENVVQYLIVGGGGGMGYGYGGAGGAGGYRAYGCGPSPLQAPAAIPTPVTTYPISVGAGGAGSPVVPGPSGFPCNSSNGSNTTGLGLTAAGGGGGASGSSGNNGKPGGSGGGGASGSSAPTTPRAGGTGNTPPVTPVQGHDGEGGSVPEGNQGGGAGAAGSYGPTGARCGVTGVSNSIDGTSRKYACGGRSGSGPTAISPRANSGFGGTCQGAAGMSGVVVIKYRVT